MKIIDLLKSDSVLLNPKIENKEEAINKLVDLLDITGRLNNKQEYKKAVLDREDLSTTGIGHNIAIPHAKTKAVKEVGLSVIILKNGIDYDSLDGQPAKLFFMIAVPDGENNIHLDVLARLSSMLMDSKFKEELMNVKNVEEFLELINNKENNKIKDEDNKKNSNKTYKVLAVTACPTGIAHTFIAAESLESKAKDMGISLKVETNGSSEIKNILTEEEIKNAECIIVAADKKVEMSRFNGKRVIQTKVANGIYKAENLLNEALSGKVPIYKYNGGENNNKSLSNEESMVRKFYKHLMNGMSYMLPFAIGGSILIALSFILKNYSIGYINLGKNILIAELVEKIGEIVCGFMLPIFSAYIAMSIADRPGLAVGFIGGIIANLSILNQSFLDGYITPINGGFLGALFAGFLGGYLIVFLKKIFNKLPSSLEGLKPTLLYPLFGIGFIIIIIAILNPFFGTINEEITKLLNSMGLISSILVGIILAGMMAIDMGGPVNKCAYVFGIITITVSNYKIMPAIMAGGMVPPLVTALATTFFKSKFTEIEKSAGVKNYMMGLSFITEGAIPFVITDPIKVKYSCVIASSISGALSILFNCSLRVPSGGIFVIPFIGNPFLYLISILIGSIIGMLILGILKKKVV